jgi:nicotinate-nucleotide pyrophosphorylase
MLTPFQMDEMIERALAEDIGTGDITTLSTIPADRQTAAV